jgi:hypothetical protein
LRMVSLSGVQGSHDIGSVNYTTRFTSNASAR